LNRRNLLVPSQKTLWAFESIVFNGHVLEDCPWEMTDLVHLRVRLDGNGDMSIP
jgi:hypothetical protein